LEQVFLASKNFFFFCFSNLNIKLIIIEKKSKKILLDTDAKEFGGQGRNDPNGRFFLTNEHWDNRNFSLMVSILNFFNLIDPVSNLF